MNIDDQIGFVVTEDYWPCAGCEGLGDVPDDGSAVDGGADGGAVGGEVWFSGKEEGEEEDEREKERVFLHLGEREKRVMVSEWYGSKSTIRRKKTDSLLYHFLSLGLQFIFSL